MDPSLRRRRWAMARGRKCGKCPTPPGSNRRASPLRFAAGQAATAAAVEACGWWPGTRRAGPCRLGRCGAAPDRRSTLTLGRQSSLRRSGEPGDAGRRHRRPASTRSRSFPKERSRAPPVPRCCRCARRGSRATGNWPRSARRPRSGAAAASSLSMVTNLGTSVDGGASIDSMAIVGRAVSVRFAS